MPCRLVSRGRLSIRLLSSALGWGWCLTLGLLGVDTVVHDGDASLCDIASANAARNGIDAQVRGMRLRWGDAEDLEAALGALGGKCASLAGRGCPL